MMKRKWIAFVLALALGAAALGLGGTAFALTPNPALAELAQSQIYADGVDTVFDGRSVRTRNNGPRLGYDVDGNAIIETQDGGPCPVLHSNEKAWLNGFSYTFKIQDKYSDKQLLDGANFDIAFYATPTTPTYYSFGVNFVVKTVGTERTLIAYLLEAGSVYRSSLGDLVGHTNRNVKLLFGEAVKLEIKKLTAAELTSYFAASEGEKLEAFNGADRGTDKEGYFIFLNGVLVQWNLTTHNVYLFPESPAHRLQLDEAKGDYFLYPAVEMNTVNAGGGPESAPVNTQDARFTLIDSALTGAETAALADFSGDDVFAAGAVSAGLKAGAAASGEFKGKTVYTGGTGLSMRAKTASALGGASNTVAVKTAGDTLRFYYKKNAQNGSFANGKYTDTDYFGIELKKLSATTASVAVVSNGSAKATQFTEASPMSFNWRGMTEAAAGAFVKDGKAVLTLNGTPLVCEEKLAVDFTSGYFYVQADEGTSQAVQVSAVTDGSAVRKVYAESLSTKLEQVKLKVGGTLPAFPEKVKVKLDDGRELEWKVTWDSSEVQTALPGSYAVKGAFTDLVDLQEDYYISSAMTGLLTIPVTVEKDVKVITAFPKPADVTIEVGGSYQLPSSLEVTLEDNSKETVEFTWTGRVNTLKAGTYTVTATPKTGYEFKDGVAATVTVTVTEKAEEPEKTGCGCGTVSGGGFGGFMGGMILLAAAGGLLLVGRALRKQR